MEATELLTSEHRIVEKVLNTLESAADKLERKEAIRAGFFVDAAQFSKGFTDGCHHRKEEGVLFNAMVHNGVADSTGPIAVMLAEHEQGRRFIKAMRAAAEELEKGDSSAAGRVIENTRGYIALLRQHITKEDNFLFPMADQVIPANEQEKVGEDFETVEEEETGAGVHEKYLGLAEALQKEVGWLMN